MPTSRFYIWDPMRGYRTPSGWSVLPEPASVWYSRNEAEYVLRWLRDCEVVRGGARVVGAVCADSGAQR